MRCPYCGIAIYAEKDMKEHIDWQHYNHQGYQVWLERDLSSFFQYDEDGKPIIPVGLNEDFPENDDKGSCLPFGMGSDVVYENGEFKSKIR